LKLAIASRPNDRSDDADQGLALAQAQAELAQDKSELARLEVGTGVKSLSASSRTTFSLCAGKKQRIT